MLELIPKKMLFLLPAALQNSPAPLNQAGCNVI